MQFIMRSRPKRVNELAPNLLLIARRGTESFTPWAAFDALSSVYLDYVSQMARWPLPGGSGFQYPLSENILHGFTGKICTEPRPYTTKVTFVKFRLKARARLSAVYSKGDV